MIEVLLLIIMLTLDSYTYHFCTALITALLQQPTSILCCLKNFTYLSLFFLESTPHLHSLSTIRKHSFKFNLEFLLSNYCIWPYLQNIWCFSFKSIHASGWRNSTSRPLSCMQLKQYSIWSIPRETIVSPKMFSA